ncbi:hypothetical protein CsSME_00007032 [Camellia sinensis var. sinensis]
MELLGYLGDNVLTMHFICELQALNAEIVIGHLRGYVNQLELASHGLMIVFIYLTEYCNLQVFCMVLISPFEPE